MFRTSLLAFVLVSLLLPVLLPAHAQERTTLTHFAPMQSLAFSPDSKTLAGGSFYGGVKLWVVDTGKELKSLAANKDVTSVAFSPDGKILAWASNEGKKEYTVRLYEVLTDKALASLTGHTDQIFSITFAPDGNTLASGGRDNTVRLWELASGKEKVSFKGHKNRITSLGFSPDGKSLASASSDGTIHLWDVATGEVRATYRHEGGVRSVAFTPDGKTLATGSNYHTVKVWEPATGKELRTLEHGSSASKGPRVSSLAIAPGGKILASVTDGRPGELRLWDLLNGKQLARVTAHKHPAEAVAFSPDGKTLASGDADGKVKLWAVAKLLEKKADK